MRGIKKLVTDNDGTSLPWLRYDKSVADGWDRRLAPPVCSSPSHQRTTEGATGAGLGATSVVSCVNIFSVQMLA